MTSNGQKYNSNHNHQHDSNNSENQYATVYTSLLSNNSDDHKLHNNNISKWQFWRRASPSYRFYALLLATLIPVGGHIVKSSLGSLQPYMLHDSNLHLNHTKFGVFQSAVSVPNLIIPFLGGIWLDIRGSKPGTLFALICCCIGHLLFSISIQYGGYTMAIVSRALFGLGQGNTVVSQGRIAAKWFIGRELILAVALTESTHNIANFVGAIYTVPTTQHFGNYIYALYIGVLFCILSLIAGIVLFATTDEVNHENDTHGEENYHIILCNKCAKQAHDTVYGIENNNYIRRSNNNVSPSHNNTLRYQNKFIPHGHFSCISVSFLCLCVLHMLFSNMNHLFTYVLANMMATDWNYSLNASALLSSLSSLIAIFLCPLFGLMLDRIGYKMYACTLAGIGSCIAYLLLAYTKEYIHPVIPLIMLSISSSFVPTVLRSSVPSLISPVLYGTAYGLYSVSESIGAVIGHSFTGYVRDKHNDYHHNLLIFAGIALLAATLSVLLSHFNPSLNQLTQHHHHKPTELKSVTPYNSIDSISNLTDCPCVCHTRHDEERTDRQERV